MTATVAAPTFASAHCLTFATYAATPLARSALEHWQASAPTGVRRQVDEIHDVLSALVQIDIERPATLADVCEAVRRLRDDALPPGQDLLGATTLVVVKTTDRNAGPSLLVGLSGVKAGPMEGGVWGKVGTVHAALDPRLIVIACPPGDAADRRLGGELYGTARLAEVMRHKVEGQYREYEDNYRPALLAAAEALDRALRPLTEQMCQAREPEMGHTLARGRAVTSAYCLAVQALAPAQRIRSMLAGNLHNLTALGGGPFWRRRARQAAQRLAQVDADLGLVRPVFDAAQWVGQFHHSRLLAQMNLTEMAENRQRDRDAHARERHNRRLMMLGVWLGLSQIWAAYLAMWPADQRPEGPALLWLSFAPTLFGLVLLGGTLLLQNLQRKPTP